MQAVMAGIGRFAVHFRYPVIALWLVATAVCTALFPSLASVANPDTSAFLPKDSPTVHALDLQAPFLPQHHTSGVLVATRDGAPLTDADHSAFTAIQAALAGVAHVSSVTDQGRSSDGQAAKALVVVDVANSDAAAGGIVDNIRAAVAGSHPPQGLIVRLTGQIATSVDDRRSQASAQRLTELASYAVILLMLALVYRAVLAPLVTLLPAALVLTLSGPIIAAATRVGVHVSAVTHPMLTVLLLGAGTDYGLFLVLRMREEMAGGAEPRQAVVAAFERVGESVSFSAGTVIVALLCLLLASFGLYASLGPALAIGVAVMLLAALTLLPALLAVCGCALFWPRRQPPQALAGNGWVRVAEHVLARPAAALFAGVVIFGGLALGTWGYTSSGFGGTTTGPSGSESAAGQDVLAAHYPPAVVTPTVVLYVFPHSVWQDLRPVQSAENQLAASGPLRSVNGLLNPNGIPVPPEQLTALHALLGPPDKLPPTPPPGNSVAPALYAAYRASTQFVSPDGRTTQFYTTLTAGQPASTAALKAVPGIRSAVDKVGRDVGAIDSGISGLAPVSHDVSALSRHDLVKIVPVVLVLIGVLLGLVLRSLVAPTYLVASVALSYIAALGLAFLLFVRLLGASGLDFVLPFLMFVFLMALGEDYNILVMSRIREEAQVLPLRAAVAKAIHATGTTVTSAGLVLAATFGITVVTGVNQEIRQLGGAIALGVLLDTFLVRTLLVPSTVILLGRRNWWPSRLTRCANPRLRLLGRK